MSTLKQWREVLDEHSRRDPEAKAETRFYLNEMMDLLEAGEKAEFERATLIADMHTAWGVIANAGGGNWDTQSLEWQEAAAKWRDLCFLEHALEGYEG